MRKSDLIKGGHFNLEKKKNFTGRHAYSIFRNMNSDREAYIRYVGEPIYMRGVKGT